MWNRDNIQALLSRSDKAVLKAITAIHALQTGTEQACYATVEKNGVGFSRYDAEPMSNLAHRIRAGAALSPGELARGRNRIKRYWRQLAEIANDAGKPVPPALGGSAVRCDSAATRIYPPTQDQRLGSWGK